MELVHLCAEQIGTTQKWWLHLPFLQLLSDLGGLPRPIGYFLEHCFGPGPAYKKGKAFFENLLQIECNSIFNIIAQTVQDRYGIEAFIYKNQQAATQVLQHSLCAIPICRDTLLSGVAVKKMELGGHVFLELTQNGWVFKMPVIFIHIYNRYLSILPHALAQPFSQDNITYWQDWEKFNTFFEALLPIFMPAGRILLAQEMSLGSLLERLRH